MCRIRVNKVEMEYAFIDIQGFRVTGRFRPKEVFFCTKQKESLEYVKMPVRMVCLTRSEKIAALWMAENHHGLAWRTNRDISVKELVDKLKIHFLGKIVFVKGEQKANWLKTVLQTYAFINLEELGCDIDLDDIECTQPNCGNHLKGHYMHCAQRNVEKLIEWFEESEFYPYKNI